MLQKGELLLPGIGKNLYSDPARSDSNAPKSPSTGVGGAETSAHREITLVQVLSFFTQHQCLFADSLKCEREPM